MPSCWNWETDLAPKYRSSVAPYLPPATSASITCGISPTMWLARQIVSFLLPGGHSSSPYVTDVTCWRQKNPPRKKSRKRATHRAESRPSGPYQEKKILWGPHLRLRFCEADRVMGEGVWDRILLLEKDLYTLSLCFLSSLFCSLESRGTKVLYKYCWRLLRFFKILLQSLWQSVDCVCSQSPKLLSIVLISLFILGKRARGLQLLRALRRRAINGHPLLLSALDTLHDDSKTAHA